MGPQQWFRKRNPDSQTAPMYRSSNNQLPMLHLADTTRNNFIAAVGEFVGTFLFLFFSFAGTQVSNTPKPAPGSPPNTSNLLYSSLCFGFSLMVNVWAFYRVTGGLFNPAVTLALCLVGGLSPIRGVILFGVQLIAGIASAGVVGALFPGDLNVGTRLGGGASISQGLFIEVFLTAQLVFIIIMLAVVKHKSTFLAPVGIGLVFFVTEMVGDYYTGGSLNPARSLGPDVINRSFPGYHWIYWDYNEWEAKMGSGGPGSWDMSMHRPSYNSEATTVEQPQSPSAGRRNHTPTNSQPQNNPNIPNIPHGAEQV
nr:MIP aquaporin [Aspergillus niger CBS 513.88]|eukprot:XP_001400871.2 MIP aquaporin [Aspergillus niger CBS 513.88]